MSSQKKTAAWPVRDYKLRQNWVYRLAFAVIWLSGFWFCIPATAHAEILIHNSTNLGSTKWGANGWGIAGGKYGEFSCSTCHGRNTGNIKRVNSTLAAPDADPFPIESDSGTVVFHDLRDGSSDFGDDTSGHATSDKICEGCHSLNKYHNYNTANNTDGLNHENLKDCITCHKHTNAFAASCTDCHGNPPSTNAHLVHAGNGAGEYALTCDTCHPVDHDGDATDISFSGIAASWGTETYSAAQMQCSSLYCHGSAVADWDGGGGGACGDCHGDVDGRPNGTDEPAGGSHLTSSHQVACTNCHSHDGSDITEHVNGDIGHTTGDALVSSAGTSVTSYTYGSTLPSSPDPDGYKYSGGTCANSCHGDLDWGGTASCVTCHNGSGSGYSLVSADSPHSITATGMSCEACHFSDHTSRTSGTVGISWYTATMGVDYTVDNMIYIAGSGSEAEACWSCHEAQTPDVSEWDGTSASYDYGSVTTGDLNWFTTSWSSANFGYKNGVLSSGMGADGASTHGTNGGADGVDQASEISCSRCHDVHGIGHNGYAAGAAPYLRGSWSSNPYNEDGAPQSTTTYPEASIYSGSSGEGLPREHTSQTVMGGYWIDQNSGSPANGDYTTHAGLCTLCHGDRASIEGLWSGHANSVAGGSGGGSNIFRNSLRNGNGTWDGGMWMGGVDSVWRVPNTPTKAWGGSLRNEDYGDGVAPMVANNPRSFNAYSWGATVDDGTTDPNFHTFTCSKCHNPHASRQPKLMVTNCLDVVHNSWDGQFTGDSNWSNWTSSTLDYNTQELAYSSTAQNCHRYVDLNGDGTPDEAGWNSVTPW